MIKSGSEFLGDCLLLDIEINERGVIYAIGAAYGDEGDSGEKPFQAGPKEKIGQKVLAELDRFGAGARYVLGHNILVHDIPRLAALSPSLKLLRKPAVDTLFLSPLAYPANPYHRLVKDYRLVRDSLNDPVSDARLAGKVFEEQWQAFSEQLAGGSELPILAASFFHGDKRLRGTGEALAAMGAAVLEGEELYSIFTAFIGERGCRYGAESLIDALRGGRLDPPMLAYAAAWLSVAGANSVLPPWVRATYPPISRILHTLREKDCGDYDKCPYCATHHDPVTYLASYFGFRDFRPEPKAEDGSSLQERVVRAAAANTTLFATLPTGGGKSLCYLLPALMRYLRRNLLTIVISPLQALMKDQVDNFSTQTGTRIAAALYGMLTMVERGEILEAIRLGDVGVLYVSPEQLRNRSFVQAIASREIGAWVFDEAHCLSKWGHDFRPDYIYAIRFIREYAARWKTQVPPVQCFTATAKKDVKAEITDIIESELGLRVSSFAGGHERVNLHYDVYAVDRYEKREVIFDLLEERYDGDGAAVIYCATRRSTEELAEFLDGRGYAAEAYHAGMDTSLKKRLLESFIGGEVAIICATNAFGMGIDKDDVRLVIHADIPGSLENYLQEAGRAGRDHKNAECILVFDEQDIEQQFRLSSHSRLTRREIAQMLRGIRFAARGEEEVVLTPGELLRQETVDLDRESLYDPDTRVRTGVAWLERAGFLVRNENNTRVFQGKPLVRDLQEAGEKIAALNLSSRQRERWLAILAMLMERREESFSADELAELGPFATAGEDRGEETETQRVVRTLHDMAAQGLLSKEMTLSAYIRYKVADNGITLLQRICAVERDFLSLLEEEAPETDTETGLELDLRQINQRLVDLGHEYSSPEGLKRVVYGLSRDGKGLAGQSGSLSLRSRGKNRFSLVLHRDWSSLKTTVTIRQQAAVVAYNTILGAVAPGQSPSANLLVSFTLEQIVAGLKGDLSLLPLLKNPLAAAERALAFMHEQGVIDLQQGLAVFSQAMTLHLHPEAKGRPYSASDFAPLKTHYGERNFQIHVINEYARQALDKLGSAMRLVASYFNDDKEDFIERYFPDRREMLERATSEQSYQRIVDDLNNPSQQTVVAAPVENNMLVLAGPGAGKTRVVTHRVAFLLRVHRVAPESILVLCFNRAAVIGLRRKLRELAGAEMSRVTTQTFHGLALQLTGRSLAVAREGGEAVGEIDFDRLIHEAVALLRGDTEVIGVRSEECRDALVGRFSHILVDEYQDINEEQYELISLLTGKALNAQEQKMTILAVGDDDQNIYRFRGANVGFLRRFREDYGAGVHYLLENYRSSANIIEAANALIAHNNDRMKTDHPLRINAARSMLPAGGNHEISDPVAAGKVQILQVDGAGRQVEGVLGEIRRLQGLETGVDLNRCAVLAREWRELDRLRYHLETACIPVNFHWGRAGGFPSLTRIRENARLLEVLRHLRGDSLTGAGLQRCLDELEFSENLWRRNLQTLIGDWREETGDNAQAVSTIEEYLYESLADQRRSRNLGNGVFLSTVHSVKGLEFDHVFILGENWQTQRGEAMEDDRRLFYVAMSRARQTLQLFVVDGIVNPHAEVIGGDFLIKRRLAPDTSTGESNFAYSLLGLEDLFIDFAGIRSEKSNVRQALAKLDCGDELGLAWRGDQLDLIDSDGVSVARLSKKAKAAWSDHLEVIAGVRVVAVVQRRRDDISDKDFQNQCRGEQWEVPVVEVQHRGAL